MGATPVPMKQLVYLSPVPWHSMSQRPHFFVEQALQCGIDRVLWIEPSPSRLPGWHDLFRFRRAAGEPEGSAHHPSVEVLPVTLLPVEPVKPLNNLLNGARLDVLVGKVLGFTGTGSTQLVIGKPTALAVRLAEMKATWTSITYDAMDDFPAFFKGIAQRSMALLEDRLVSLADHLLCSSHPLEQKFSGQCRLVLNACTQDFTPNARPEKHTADARIIGYVGTIAHWFDWDLVRRLAIAFPQHKILITGPQKTPAPGNLPANIQLHASLPHSKIPALLRTFDYGLIPFKINRLTESVDPIKYYEYCATGIPVLTSRFGEMKRRDAQQNTWLLEEVIASRSLPMTPSSSPTCTTWADRFTCELFNRLIDRSL